MTLGEWDKSVEKLSDEQLAEIKKALETLNNWPDFKQEFKWTGIFALYPTLDGEQLRRSGEKRMTEMLR